MRKWNVNRVVLCVFLTGLVLSGCQDVASPDATIASAYSQLSQNNLKGFQQDLSNPALTDFGTPAGMAEINAIIAGKKLSLTADQLIAIGTDQYGAETDTYQTTAVDIASGAPLLLFTVVCSNSYINSCVPSQNDPARKPPADCILEHTLHCSIPGIIPAQPSI